MPRAGWVKPQDDQRLSDHVALGVLTRTFPPALVDEILAETGRGEQRSRLLPARLVVYYVLGLALFSQSSYEEVMRNLVEGLSWSSGWARTWKMPSKSAIFQARARLGVQPLETLFERGCVPLATPDTSGAFYRDWRLVAFDGTCLDVADNPANDEAFGRPGASRGTSAFPQVRLVGFAECGTHAITGAAIGPYSESEQSLTHGLLGHLGPGMLCLADRGFAGFPLLEAARATGADLLWRARNNAVLPVLETFDDGSFRSEIVATPDKRTRANVISVRVIEYTVTDPGRPETAERYRLLTTIMDPTAAPADELAALYAERWEIETALDELKTHQRGPRVVLRSKTPDGVRQEIYGHLCTHYAIRALMSTAAEDRGVDPDRISFTRTLRAARRSTRAGLGTATTNLAVALTDTITEILHELLPARRLRAAARVVKRKMSNYGVKHRQHRDWPRPTLTPPEAVHILAPP
jgi:hypothetical protein